MSHEVGVTPPAHGRRKSGPRVWHWSRALIPGWVTWSRGRKVRGALAFILGLLIAGVFIAAGVYAILRPDDALLLVTDTDALLIATYALAGMGAIVVLMMMGTLISLKRASGVKRTRWGTFVLAMVLIGQASAFSIAAYEVHMQRNLVLTIFAAPDAPTYTPEPSASPTEPDIVGTINVLLIGADAAPNRWGARTDSLAVAHIDLATGDVLMIGIPRNLHGIVFSKGSPMLIKWPNGYDCGKRCMINAVYQYAVGHAGLYNKAKYKGKDPGVEALREAVQGTLAIRVDYYMMIDMKGFTTLVDKVGGIVSPKKFEQIAVEYLMWDANDSAVTKLCSTHEPGMTPAITTAWKSSDSCRKR